MPSARLLSRVVSIVATVSAGAVLADPRSGEAGQPPSILAALLRLVAQTIAADPHAEERALREVESALRSFIVRHGTLGLALEALAAARRRDPAIALDKAQSWARCFGVSVSAVEATMRKYPRTMFEVSRWIAAQGESLEGKLTEFEQWLDGEITASASAQALARAVESGVQHAGDEAPNSLAPDVVLARRLALDDKPLADTPLMAVTGGVELEVAERLIASDCPFARATGLVLKGKLDEAERVLTTAAGKAEAADLATLKGDIKFFGGAYDEAARCYRTARTARDDSMARLNLATALTRAQKPSSETATKEAIDLLSNTRDHLEPTTRGWAIASARQGAAWLRLTSGDRDANTRRAIERLEESLGVVDREGEPQWWAQIHAQLGSAWMALRTGKRVENVQRAITCFTRAEDIWTRAQSPERWASVQNSLGQAWEQLPLGHRSVNLTKAIGYFSAALEVTDKDESPTAWAMLQNNLGNAWVQETRGDAAENIEKAIKHHTAALDVWSTHERRAEWAATQNNLGNAWALSPAATTEEREKRLRRAVACYKSALEVRTRMASASEWATTQNNMGSALLQLAKSSGLKALEEAIVCFERALEVRTRSAAPLDWARTMTNLGHAWAKRTDGDRTVYMRKAIECYSSALEVIKREQYPHLHQHIVAKLNETQDQLDEAQLLR